VPDDVIRLGPHQTLRVVESTEEALVLDARWEPGSTQPIAHLHPAQDERFEILEGRITLRLGEEERVVGTGESFDVPRGTVHAMWNAHDEPARATWRVTPALRTEEMFRTIAGGGVPDFLERFSAELRLVVER
jgi:quercetin dioxygenase-like cupin family protein